MAGKIIVVGGGASGMMAAITAARAGASVSILEHNDRIGKKILSTGNGRCNFTNVTQEPFCYRSEDPLFPWKVIKKYDAQRTIMDFMELGIYSKNKNGGMYPFSEQASAVLDVLRMEIERLGIPVFAEEHVTAIQKQKKGFRIRTKYQKKAEHEYRCDRVILAAGSKAAAKLGSDGSGYDLAKMLGHHMIPVVPALVQLRCRESFYKALAGVRVHGKVSLDLDRERIWEDTGEIQLTDYGISGIPVFQISRFAARGLYEKKEVTAVLDFMPEFADEAFLEFLRRRALSRPEKRAEMFLTGILHKKLSSVLLKEAGISPQKQVGKLTGDELKRLARTIKHFRTEVMASNSFEQAQICAGGVDTREISPVTMESRLTEGLFFAGEVLDVDGMCGGYNLQWAWSSGYLAGKGAANA